MEEALRYFRGGMGLTALSLLCTLPIGCGGLDGDEKAPSVENEPAEVQLFVAPDSEEVAGATFHGLAGISGSVTLRNGRWEAAPPEGGGASGEFLVLADTPALLNDFEGDGLDETVVFLSSGGGGSGAFLNLAVVERVGEGVASRAVALVGNRVQLRDARVEGALIILDLVQHGEDDPLCCPGDLATRVWRLEGRRLVEIQEEVTGRLHPDVRDEAYGDRGKVSGASRGGPEAGVSERIPGRFHWWRKASDDAPF